MLGSVNVPGVSQREVDELKKTCGSILRMLMLREASLPMADHQGKTLCTRDGTAIAAVRKI